MRMTIKTGTSRLIRIVCVLRLTRTHSKGEITVKLPNVSAEVVPYMTPKMGDIVKTRIPSKP